MQLSFVDFSWGPGSGSYVCWRSMASQHFSCITPYPLVHPFLQKSGNLKNVAILLRLSVYGKKYGTLYVLQMDVSKSLDVGLCMRQTLYIKYIVLKREVMEKLGDLPTTVHANNPRRNCPTCASNATGGHNPHGIHKSLWNKSQKSRTFGNLGIYSQIINLHFGLMGISEYLGLLWMGTSDIS